MSAAEALPVFRVRPSTPDDRKFVLSRWLWSEEVAHAHREGNLFRNWQNTMMDAILARPGTTIRVASPADDDAIAGFAVVGHERAPTAPPVVFYAYVDEAARRMGIASLLLGDLLARRDVIYTAIPARVCKECGDSVCRGRPKHRQWVPSPVQMPRQWHYLPRAAFLPVLENR